MPDQSNSLANDDPLRVNSNVERILVGGLGGFAAILVKYISQDHAAVVTFISTHTKAGIPFSYIFDIVGGYFILAPLIVILGAIIGWVSAENQRIKLFALGVSAPALVTTFSTGSAAKVAFLEITSAYAQGVQEGSVAAGLNSFFGGSDKAYAIYVGSFATQEKIDRIVHAINEQTKTLHAVTVDVTDTAGNKLKRIYILQMFGLKEALDVRDKLLQTGLVDEATITRGTKGTSPNSN
ncbi:hypothetical protein [Bradyrhizobium genosp. A]|uniref:hypothetical protein n=1 Tax=Bradyrhizobium genosp. A TaxID=83626 RepID=UPI003CF804DA